MAGEGQRIRRLNKQCILLIVIAGMERFAYKGVVSNMVTYLTNVVKMSNSSAARTVNTWCGVTSMLPLLVAPLVDSCWDRFSTILASASLYTLGLSALTTTALEWPWRCTTVSLFLSLYIISLGQGGFNPSLQAFGADQLEIEPELLPEVQDDSNSGSKTLFFQWWYFGVCIGSLLGISIMAYIQDTLGWGLGFAIPTISMFSSVLLFSLGSRFYAYKQGKSIVSLMFLVNILRTLKATASRLTKMCKGSSVNLMDSKSEAVELELQEKPLFQHNQNGTKAPGDESCTYMQVVVRLLPIWTTLLMFAVIFQQPPTFFTKQGMAMKRNIGSKFKIPPAALQSAITLSIIALMPLYHTFFIPFARFITRNEKGVSVPQRMGIGMFLSVIAMILAAVVETKRLESTSRKTEHSEGLVPLSIFWLLPQYIILGISDIFTVVGMQEFFYSQVPENMKTMGIALYTSVFGVGSFLSALLILLVEYLTSCDERRLGWFDDDDTRLDKYYWLLALLSASSLITYLVLCRIFKLK